MRNPMAYSPGVLVGNWYEDMRVREDKVTFYKSKYSTTGSHGTQRSTTSHLSEATSVGMMKDVVMLGEPLQLINVATSAVLALDTAPERAPRPNQCLVTAARTEEPQIRSSWVIHRATDENNLAYTKQLKEENVLHYGQHVRIANEDAHPDGFYYLHSSIREIGTSGKQSLTAALGASRDNTFVVVRPGSKRDDISDGTPVRVGEPFLLYHAPTNQPIRCSKKIQKTSFGSEFEVSCSFAGGNHSRSLGAVTTDPENLFMIAGSTIMSPSSAMSAALKSRSERSDRSGIMSFSMSCGMGVDLILSRIREGALAVGGRLGFRTLSKAMGTACNEKRITLVNREKIHHGVRLMGVAIQPLELDVLFKKFDRDGNGLIVAQEFLRELREDMPPQRLDAVIKAFQQLTIEGAGSVDFVDMLNLFKFNATQIPDVERGILSYEEAIFDFINCWPGKNNTDTVTLDDFVAYYTDVSPAVEDDESFMALVERSWTIPETDAYRTGRPRRCVTVTHKDDTQETIYLPDSLILDPTNSAAIQSILIQHGVKDIKGIHVTM
ncbi:EF hand family protein [Trypanosoma theileri]|uniref:EF hand family protein n=1 Tax=Trypanosoma theileri TaxID=67003 RepID=A0A1X0P3R1_9TRYP|nr:EF hand family protein [Trypanosoma theileri]ORC91491.1 EF hand family protein [Trypanosoma theileri]